jgi:hypothetical protein
MYLGENDRPVASHWQTLSHNVASSTPRHELDSNSHNVLYMALIAIRTHKISGDRHLEIQLPYERDHDTNNRITYSCITPQFAPRFVVGSCYSIFSFICMFCRSLFVILYYFMLAIMLSVLLWYTDSDYLFCIFLLFLQNYNVIYWL